MRRKSNFVPFVLEAATRVMRRVATYAVIAVSAAGVLLLAMTAYQFPGSFTAAATAALCGATSVFVWMFVEVRRSKSGFAREMRKAGLRLQAKVENVSREAASQVMAARRERPPELLGYDMSAPVLLAPEPALLVLMAPLEDEAVRSTIFAAEERYRRIRKTMGVGGALAANTWIWAEALRRSGPYSFGAAISATAGDLKKVKFPPITQN